MRVPSPPLTNPARPTVGPGADGLRPARSRPSANVSGPSVRGSRQPSDTPKAVCPPGARLGPCRLGRRALAVALAALAAAAGSPRAETLEGSLGRAYRANPELNATRAGLRATDEEVAMARAGYRPTVAADADIGVQNVQGASGGERLARTSFPRGAGLTVEQTLFNGFQTDNDTRRAESNVLEQREVLRSAENTILFNAAQAYMDVLRDTATVELNRNNIAVLEEQRRQTSLRFRLGELTRTDAAQADARLAGARSQLSAAEAQLRARTGVFRQVIGVDPHRLAPGRPLDRLVPPRLELALGIGLAEHPRILSALHAVDAAEAQAKVFEGRLYPRAGASGVVQRRRDEEEPGDDVLAAGITGQVTVPVYEGGQVYAQVRRAKEQAGQLRIEAEQVRDAVRAGIVAAWAQLEASKAQVAASQAQVQANEVALAGVRDEARAGQRTTLDVLNAQQELLNARVGLVVAQRDRVVFSYGLVQALGRLTARFAELPVAPYGAKAHYDQVENLWAGLRTPDGR
ncbi:outer membrane protein [Methylobacterium sp. PvP062]|uniref:TolC family outer membrane protein n=1 Tax=Methylobacterium TaxID=407 RepID=UPI0007A5C6CF|nr:MULTISPECIES: TolC family outer membrane protein [unclassified Methylobacterium]KZC01458.1 Outer membrane efflux protein BepC [Methylobacterium radiotolerans]MCX7333133.1 TolC family outer membrane protein [Hyphomicrobiales bacterium]